MSLPPLSASLPCRSSWSTRLSGLPVLFSNIPLTGLHLVVYICQYHFLSLSHPPLPQLCSQVCSLLGSSVPFFYRFHMYSAVTIWITLKICKGQALFDWKLLKRLKFVIQHFIKITCFLHYTNVIILHYRIIFLEFCCFIHHVHACYTYSSMC